MANMKTRDHFRCGREYKTTDILTQFWWGYKLVQPLWENKWQNDKTTTVK